MSLHKGLRVYALILLFCASGFAVEIEVVYLDGETGNAVFPVMMHLASIPPSGALIRGQGSMDATGETIFTDIEVGKYQLIIAPAADDIALIRTNIVVDGKQAKQRIIFYAEKGYVLSGKIVDNEGLTKYPAMLYICALDETMRQKTWRDTERLRYIYENAERVALVKDGHAWKTLSLSPSIYAIYISSVGQKSTDVYFLGDIAVSSSSEDNQLLLNVKKEQRVPEEHWFGF